jgi:hypothetical protein
MSIQFDLVIVHLLESNYNWRFILIKFLYLQKGIRLNPILSIIKKVRVLINF